MKLLSRAGSFSVSLGSAWSFVRHSGAGCGAWGPGLRPGSALQVNPADKRVARELRPGKLSRSCDQERANAGKGGEKGCLESGREAALGRLLKVTREAGRAEANDTGATCFPGRDFSWVYPEASVSPVPTSIINAQMRCDAYYLSTCTFVLISTESRHSVTCYFLGLLFKSFHQKGLLMFLQISFLALDYVVVTGARGQVPHVSARYRCEIVVIKRFPARANLPY